MCRHVSLCVCVCVLVFSFFYSLSSSYSSSSSLLYLLMVPFVLHHYCYESIDLPPRQKQQRTCFACRVYFKKKTWPPLTWEYVDSGLVGPILISKFWGCLDKNISVGKFQGWIFVLVFEVSESARYEVGVRSNLGNDRIRIRRTHCYSVVTTNYLRGGRFESEYLDQFHISIQTHILTLGNLLQML